MIYSMTGYAAASRDLGSAVMNFEIKSVNSRYLDIGFRLSEDLRFLEMPLREKLTDATLRADQLQKSIEKMTVTAARAGTIVYPTSWRGEKKKVGDSTWRMEVVLQVVGLDQMIGRGEVDEIEMALEQAIPGLEVSTHLEPLPESSTPV